MDFFDSVANFLGSLRSLIKIPSKPPQAPPAGELLYKVPIWILLAYVGNFIFEGIWNTSNHPLAQFPGPVLAGFTSWYKTYIEVFRGESWIDKLEELHEKYGKIVRVGPNELHFSDPAAYHEIYNNNNRWDKEASFYQAFGEGHSSFGFLTYAESKRRKDIMNPLFSRRAIFDLQDLIQSKVDRLCEALTANNKNAKSSDLFFGLRCFTLDAVTSFCFAKSVDALGEADFKAPIIEAMEAVLPALVVFKHFRLIRKAVFAVPSWLSIKKSPNLVELTDLQKLLRIQVKEVTSNPYSLLEASHPIIYHELLSPAANGGGKVPNATSLYEEAQALILGGAVTSANILILGIFNMLEQPALMARLRKELLGVWPVLENAPPTYEELEKLPFLTAVIKESLRIGPGGIASPLPRVVPKGGATISGSFVPAETTVGMAGYFVHNSRIIFKDPKRFDPDRWLGEDATLSEKWLVSFSKGPRMCLGQNLAWCELYLAFASLFRRFELKLDSVSGHVSDLKWRDCFLPCFQGPHLQAFCQPAVK